jgi:hypothetical protein
MTNETNSAPQATAASAPMVDDCNNKCCLMRSTSSTLTWITDSYFNNPSW